MVRSVNIDDGVEGHPRKYAGYPRVTAFFIGTFSLLKRREIVM